MEHPVEAHAVRLTAGGRTLVYSGDTARSEALVELARDCDLLLCEASWPSDPEPPPGIHLTGREAGDHAARAGAARLVLTHLMPFADPRRSARGGARVVRRPAGARPLRRRLRRLTASRRVTRPGGRAPDSLRTVSLTRGWLDHAEGSCLVEFGATRVLVRRQRAGVGAALAQGLGPGLGDGGVRDAARARPTPAATASR